MVVIFATPGVRAVSSDRSLAGWHGVTLDSLLLEHLAGSSWKCVFVSQQAGRPGWRAKGEVKCLRDGGKEAEMKWRNLWGFFGNTKTKTNEKKEKNMRREKKKDGRRWRAWNKLFQARPLLLLNQLVKTDLSSRGIYLHPRETVFPLVCVWTI